MIENQQSCTSYKETFHMDCFWMLKKTHDGLTVTSTEDEKVVMIVEGGILRKDIKDEYKY